MHPGSPLSILTTDQLHARAREYRTMASMAKTVDMPDALRWLADQFEAMAEDKAAPQAD